MALLFIWYRFKLRSGLLRVQTPPGNLNPADEDFGLQPVFKPPSRSTLEELLADQTDTLLLHADEVLNGLVRLFGAETQPLSLSHPTPLEHWTVYTDRLPGGEDIKPLWEMGRFGWALSLARAYQISADEKYTRAFWERLEEFLVANPPNMGPHWSSAQEVGLRLISLAVCFSVFAGSQETTAERRNLLAAGIVTHADRIPPTLVYSRAQNNNHLLSEALGLITAASLLPNHPRAQTWRALGCRWFEHGLLSQIQPDGSYSQHSANYHRLMLQLGLWANLLANQAGVPLSAMALERLATSTRWLLTLLDVNSGKVPNLGPNDGAYILPLSILPFDDYRPVLQAAGRAFLNEQPLPPGVWDEMALWLVPPHPKPQKTHKRPRATKPPLRLQAPHSWGYLRAAHFRDTPGHADQLHLDLWWHDLNVARDAGTYLYTAPAPWENALGATRAHNTLTLNGLDQMTRAGRFLWLDWAQAHIVDTNLNELGQLRSVTAEHDGYQAVGLRHRRSVRVEDDDTWLVEDQVISTIKSAPPVDARLHWLLPDWNWKLSGNTLELGSDFGPIKLSIQSRPQECQFSVIRAGQVLLGDTEPDPILGWFSPTYSVKEPALSLVAALETAAPLSFTTKWRFPEAA